MMNRKLMLSAWLVGGTLLLGACDDEKAPAAPPAPSATQAPLALSAAPAASAAAPSVPSNARPTKLDTELTDARRASIEAKYPAAKGFLASAQLEAKLKADKTLKDKKSGLAAFDRAARGKWVLFTGQLVNLTPDGFDLVIVYTPQLPNDPMGMSRQFFEVTLSKVEGYSQGGFKAGDSVVVLAKYAGGGKAEPGHELVATGAWQ